MLIYQCIISLAAEDVPEVTVPRPLDMWFGIPRVTERPLSDCRVLPAVDAAGVKQFKSLQVYILHITRPPWRSAAFCNLAVRRLVIRRGGAIQIPLTFLYKLTLVKLEAIVGDPTRWRVLCRRAALAMWVFPCNRTYSNLCLTQLVRGLVLHVLIGLLAVRRIMAALAHLGVKLRAPRPSGAGSLSLFQLGRALAA